MIAHVFGIVVEKSISSVTVDVGGLGYEVAVTQNDYDAIIINESIKLFTYHHIREQSQELFGFMSLASKKLFEMLITVQGVGPKAALSILGLGDCENVRNAIANGDSAYITKASGIGKKTAERVVLDLVDKVGIATSYGVSEPSRQCRHNDEALEALMALGYNLNDATRALEDVPIDMSTADRVTMALKGK